MGALNEDRVKLVFMDCLWKEGEGSSKQITVGGLGHRVRFHKGRIAGRRSAIGNMLAELPDKFKTNNCEFEEAGVDRAGNHWAPKSNALRKKIIQYLLQLGIASGMVECEQPEEKWDRYPSFRVKG